jgi:hypothetical protein
MGGCAAASADFDHVDTLFCQIFPADEQLVGAFAGAEGDDRRMLND